MDVKTTLCAYWEKQILSLIQKKVLTVSFFSFTGSLYVTSSFDDATPLGEVKCGNVSQVYSLKKIQFDYVHIRFHGNKMAAGYRGMYAVYNIYGK